MAFGTKALKAKVAQVEADAKKAIQTLKDRAAMTEATVKALAEADAPEAIADVTKLAADLASAVARIEALETAVKAAGLKDAAAAASEIAKGAAKVKSATVTVETAPAAAEAPATEAATQA